MRSVCTGGNVTDFNYTPDQQMAMEYPGNVIVSAGAGSGKTRILVERYVRLLLEEYPSWPVEYVVAITFTRKAAAELKSRVVDTVQDMLKLEAEESDRWRRLKEIRNAVGAAPIGTIHNFCGRLLREFAYDAHVDPDFVVLEGAEEASTRLKAVRATVAHAAAGSNELMYKALLRLMMLYSATALENILAGMLGKRSTFLKAAERFASSEIDKLWDDLMEFHGQIVESLREGFKQRWLMVLQNLRERSAPGVVLDAASVALNAWPDARADHWQDYEGIIGAARDALLTKPGTCRKREFAKAGFEEFDGLRDELELLTREYDSANLGELGEPDRLDLERSRDMAILFLYAVEEYARLRGGGDDEGEAQLLDYEDMEILAGRLLSGGMEVVQRIRKRYPYLIIDEFQDTSQSQWDILSPLVTDENGKLLPACLFIVGDKKQGVYGFREANVNLFSQLQTLVPESNMDFQGGNGRVSMRANFRTHSDTLGYINQTFERLLDEPENPYSVDFEPLEAYSTKGEGRIEYLLIEGSGENGEMGNEFADDEEFEIGEPELVAAHINELLKGENYKAGDIALLFRKRAAFQRYEEAIKRYGIPVVSQQATNLFHQPELADVMAALEVIAYPHKDLAFMHYLRSPSIGFQDNLILKIARSRGRSLYDKARLVLQRGTYQLDDQFHPISDAEQHRLTFALSLLDRARRMVGHYDPYHIVKFIIEETGIYFSVLSDYRGKQAQANLDKMLHQAHLGSGLSFEDFLEYLDSEKQTMAGVGEAIDLGISDAVKIMTIHASKGLEFPVVYLPSMNSGTGGQPDTVGSDGSGWMSVRVSSSVVETSSFLMDHFVQVSREQQKAEERRIFYVAMTRCKNLLVLSADEGKRARGETFYQWILDDFEAARKADRLKRLEDYPDIADMQKKPMAAAGEKLEKAGRQERVSRALHLAESLKRDRANERRLEKMPGVSALGFYLDAVLPDLCRFAVANGRDATLAKYCASIGSFPLKDEAWPIYQQFCRGMIFQLEELAGEGRLLRVGPFVSPAEPTPFGPVIPDPLLRVDTDLVWVSTSEVMDSLMENSDDDGNGSGVWSGDRVWFYRDLLRMGEV